MDQQLSKLCNIILPIHDNPNCAQDCIDSLIKHTPNELYQLTIVDDSSDLKTHEILLLLTSGKKNIRLITNDDSVGYLKSCNIGIKLNNSEYIVLINSEVLVVARWLERLLACINSDPNIASVNPLTNHVSQTNLPITAGANFVSMDQYIQAVSQKKYPDVVTGGAGFCQLLKCSVLDDVGFFDEMYDHGDCEESDLCMRLTANGYRTVVADNVYVYHKGAADPNNRNEIYLKNRKIFDERWLGLYKKQSKAFQKDMSLAYLRNSLRAPQRWMPLTSMRETYRSMRDKYRARDYNGVFKIAIRGMLNLPLYTEDVISTGFLDKFSQPSQLRVTYVLHNITVAGGVLSVVQLVNELILLGVDARIVSLYQYPEMQNWKFYFSPIVFKNENDLIENFPESDVVVATHWTTASWVSKLLSSGKAKKGVYFLQDYESWFYPKADSKSRTMVKETYSMLENKIVKSSWLQDMIKGDGFQSKKIWLGMDLAIFYPRAITRNRATTIIAMARPRTPRRGFNTLINALALIKRKYSNIEIILFGDDLSKQTIPFEFNDKGVIYKQDALAQLYSIADIYIDASDFQGFGRTALEAMACEVACVLTNVGGVSEYATHEYNCLFVPPKAPEKIADSVIRLLNNKTLAADIIKGGRDTANKFSHKKEAIKTLEYFQKL